MFPLPIMVTVVVMYLLLFLSVVAVISLVIAGMRGMACREAGGEEGHGEEKQHQYGCMQSV